MIAKDNSGSGGIRWEEVKQRLARTEDALAAAEQLSPEQAKAVMDERARALAHVPARAPDVSEIAELMTFRLAAERFAVETRFVREVCRPGDITPVPGGPSFLAGVMNLRGEILAVMDLREFFGLPAGESKETSQLVILGADQPEFGVLADSVQEVVTLRIDQVLQPPASVTGASREYLRGVTKDALLVLDGDALLTDERLYIDNST